jgi:hypothetical protein
MSTQASESPTLPEGTQSSEQSGIEILTEKEFAERVGSSESTVARRRKKRLIDYRRDGKRIYYLAPDDVISYHDRMKRPAKPSRA